MANESNDPRHGALDHSSPSDQTLETLKKYQNFIIAGVVVILLAVGYFIWQNRQKANREEQARPLMAAPETYFAIDSFNLALYGDGQNPGFIDIASNYSGSKSANLAHFYAGLSFLKMGDFQQAVDHLEDFETESDEGEARAKWALGNAYAELGNTGKALSNYEEAAEESENDALKAFYMHWAGQYLMSLERWDEAAEYFEELHKNYPNTREGVQAEQYLAYVKQKQN